MADKPNDEPTWAEIKEAEQQAATQAQQELPKGVDRHA